VQANKAAVATVSLIASIFVIRQPRNRQLAADGDFLFFQ
jgi:hypothetical protein